MRRRNFFLLFILPFLGLVLIFFFLSSLNRAFIRNKTEELVQEQLQATAEILKTDIAHFLREDLEADSFFEKYARESNIYYMALLDENRDILSWSSQFEGYLPLSLRRIKEEESWVIDSPAGKIFNIFSSFSPEEGSTYYLYLGYSLKNLEEMIAYSRRNFVLVFGSIFVIGLFFFFGFYKLQRYYLQKEKEADEERNEKERYREISAFTSGVAHEIKNPLNSLYLLCELLQRKVPEELKEEVSLGKEEVQKISRIIDQFSTSLKPIRLNKETFLLRELMASVHESLKKEWSQRSVTVRYSESATVVLDADKGLMSQALSNLLKNAIEASNGGEVFTKARQERKRIFIVVEDRGKGMEDEDMARIFEPFFSRKEKGMGIGLYLTKKIIEAHQGKIEVQTKTGEGTTVLIQLPGG